MNELWFDGLSKDKSAACLSSCKYMKRSRCTLYNNQRLHLQHFSRSHSANRMRCQECIDDPSRRRK
jgi:hypothetical protein